MSPQIKYAYKRHNTWIYRRTYPKALQPILGTAFKQSLKTGDATQAKARVAELNQTFTTLIKEAQAYAAATSLTVTPTDTPLLSKLLDWGLLALGISGCVLWGTCC